MNEELLRRLIEQAMQDEEFRQDLLEDPDSVLTQWGFTPEEVANFKTSIEQGTPLEELDERISKYLFGGGGPGSSGLLG